MCASSCLPTDPALVLQNPKLGVKKQLTSLCETWTGLGLIMSQAGLTLAALLWRLPP